MSDWSLIVPHLYISDYPSTYDKEFMSMIDCVITIMDKDIKIKGIKEHLYLFAEDVPEFNISQYFEVSYNFLNRNIRKKRNVLVHCRAGISRSVTIVCYYLMKKYGIHSPEKVLDWVREKREQANPNKGFMRQLKQVTY